MENNVISIPEGEARNVERVSGEHTEIVRRDVNVGNVLQVDTARLKIIFLAGRPTQLGRNGLNNEGTRVPGPVAIVSLETRKVNAVRVPPRNGVGDHHQTIV